MKYVRFPALFLIILSLAGVMAAQAPAKTFTEKDREAALKYLNETKDEFTKQMTGLSDAQLNFRAGEGRWTIGEIAEHIIVTENALYGMITNQVMKAAAPKCEDPFRVGDTAIVLAITNRSQKFTAPEQIRPNGRWKTRDELVTNFEKTRNQTIESMKSNKADLRNLFAPSPFGTLDGVQWFLFVSGHADRHLAQLREVKADAKYPAK